MKYDRQNIPEMFMNDYNIYELLKDKITMLEVDRNRQETIDYSYTEFLDILVSQMKKHLNPREVNLSAKGGKKRRVSKPWWNDDLTGEWNELC